MVITDTSTVPGVTVAGDTTVSSVADTTVAATGASPSKATVAPDTNPVPATVTSVPPDVGPEPGDTDDTTGCGATYRKSSAAAPCAPAGSEFPPDVVTTTLTSPGVTVAGDTAVTCVDDTTTTSDAGSDPNFTDAPDTNPDPVIVTLVPPDVGPDTGDTDDTVGTGATYRNEPADTDPADVVTTTATEPGVTVAGVRTVIDVDDTTDTDNPATPPNDTDAPEMNPDPVTVTNVSPADEPDTGNNDTTDGATAT